MNQNFLPAQHKPFWMAFYRWFSRWFFAFSFQELILHKTITWDERATLLLGNHFSFHEGFWLYHLNHTWIKKKFHLMMMEQELRNRISLNKVGVFSVNKGNRSLLHTLQYTRELLQQPGNLVVVFPAGRIQSQYDDHIPFSAGIDRILKGQPEVQVVFQAAFTDYSSHRKPTVELFFTEYEETDRTLNALETAYNSFYRESRDQHIAKINAEHS